MSAPGQFVKLAMPEGARLRAELVMDAINPLWRSDRPTAWAGLAAEEALVAAYAPSAHGDWIERSESRACDLVLTDPRFNWPYRIEVKTRAASEGWTDPRLFEWITVPTHEGRAPVKEVNWVWFCWWSGSRPDELWALGYVCGLTEFKRRSHFYREGQPLPRGGWAPEGGAYCLEVRQLRPFPANMFRSKS